MALLSSPVLERLRYSIVVMTLLPVSSTRSTWRRALALRVFRRQSYGDNGASPRRRPQADSRARSRRDPGIEQPAVRLAATPEPTGVTSQTQARDRSGRPSRRRRPRRRARRRRIRHGGSRERRGRFRAQRERGPGIERRQVAGPPGRLREVRAIAPKVGGARDSGPACGSCGRGDIGDEDVAGRVRADMEVGRRIGSAHIERGDRLARGRFDRDGSGIVDRMVARRKGDLREIDLVRAAEAADGVGEVGPGGVFDLAAGRGEIDSAAPGRRSPWRARGRPDRSSFRRKRYWRR